MTTESITADRQGLADYLAMYGPTPGPVLREALGWTQERFWNAVYGPTGDWFLLTTRGWTATPRGRNKRTTRHMTTAAPAGGRTGARTGRAGRGDSGKEPQTTPCSSPPKSNAA